MEPPCKPPPWPQDSPRALGDHVRYIEVYAGLTVEAAREVGERMQSVPPRLASQGLQTVSFAPLTDTDIIGLAYMPCAVRYSGARPLIQSDLLVSVRNIAWLHVVYGAELPATDHPVMCRADSDTLCAMNIVGLNSVDPDEVEQAIDNDEVSLFAFVLGVVIERLRLAGRPLDNAREYAATAMKTVLQLQRRVRPTTAVDLKVALDYATMDVVRSGKCGDYYGPP